MKEVKKTPLENLIYESGLNNKEFSKIINIEYQSHLARLKQNKNHLKYAFEYAVILGVNRIHGYMDNVFVDLTFENKK
jgi:hypothetical protein